MASGLTGDLVAVATQEGSEFSAPQVLAEASSRDDHVLDKVQADDLRPGPILEMAANRVSDHVLQGLEGVRLGVDRLTERPGLVAALG